MPLGLYTGEDQWNDLIGVAPEQAPPPPDQQQQAAPPPTTDSQSYAAQQPYDPQAGGVSYDTPAPAPTEGASAYYGGETSAQGTYDPALNDPSVVQTTYPSTAAQGVSQTDYRTVNPDGSTGQTFQGPTAYDDASMYYSTEPASRGAGATATPLTDAAYGYANPADNPRYQSNPGALTPTADFAAGAGQVMHETAADATGQGAQWLANSVAPLFGIDPNRGSMYYQALERGRDALGYGARAALHMPQGAANLVTTPLGIVKDAWNPGAPGVNADAPIAENVKQLQTALGPPVEVYGGGAKDEAGNTVGSPLAGAVTGVRNMLGDAKDAFLDEPTKAWQSGPGAYFDQSYQDQKAAIDKGLVPPGETSKAQSVEDAATGAVEAIDNISGIPTTADLEQMSLDGLRVVMSNPKTPEGIKQQAGVIVGRRMAQQAGTYDGPLVQAPDIAGVVGRTAQGVVDIADRGTGAPPQSSYDPLAGAAMPRAPRSAAMPAPPPADPAHRVQQGVSEQVSNVPPPYQGAGPAPAPLPLPAPPPANPAHQVQQRVNEQVSNVPPYYQSGPPPSAEMPAPPPASPAHQLQQGVTQQVSNIPSYYDETPPPPASGVGQFFDAAQGVADRANQAAIDLGIPGDSRDIQVGDPRRFFDTAPGTAQGTADRANQAATDLGLPSDSRDVSVGNPLDFARGLFTGKTGTVTPPAQTGGGTSGSAGMGGTPVPKAILGSDGEVIPYDRAAGDAPLYHGNPITTKDGKPVGNQVIVMDKNTGQLTPTYADKSAFDSAAYDVDNGLVPWTLGPNETTNADGKKVTVDEVQRLYDAKLLDNTDSVATWKKRLEGQPALIPDDWQAVLDPNATPDEVATAAANATAGGKGDAAAKKSATDAGSPLVAAPAGTGTGTGGGSGKSSGTTTYNTSGGGKGSSYYNDGGSGNYRRSGGGSSSSGTYRNSGTGSPPSGFGDSGSSNYDSVFSNPIFSKFVDTVGKSNPEWLAAIMEMGRRGGGGFSSPKTSSTHSGRSHTTGRSHSSRKSGKSSKSNQASQFFDGRTTGKSRTKTAPSVSK
jgi:hypothetical protein